MIRMIADEAGPTQFAPIQSRNQLDDDGPPEEEVNSDDLESIRRNPLSSRHKLESQRLSIISKEDLEKRLNI